MNQTDKGPKGNKEVCSTTEELRSTLPKICNDFPQKPVENFHKRLQVCVEIAGEHYEDFTRYIFHTTVLALSDKFKARWIRKEVLRRE